MNFKEEKVSSPEAMVKLGEALAKPLKIGCVLALQGDLGAGKTHFTKGLVRGLGCEKSVTSPTFSLVHEYEGGVLPLYHFDFYRMESEEEVLSIGWDEYLEEDGVVVVEWANKFPDLLPDGAMWLDFEVLGDSRIVKLRR